MSVSQLSTASPQSENRACHLAAGRSIAGKWCPSLIFTSLRSSPSGFTDKVASVNESFGRIFKCKLVRRIRTKEIGLVVFVRSSSDGNGARFRFPSVKLVRRTRTKEKVSVILMWKTFHIRYGSR